MVPWTRRAAIAAALALSIVAVPAVASAAPPPQAPAYGYYKHVCATATAGHASCNADIVTDAKGKPFSTVSSIAGYQPDDLQSAYAAANAAATAGVGQTVAIVDAYDDPTAQADLDTYRSTFGLPACDGGCFSKVNQTGGSTPPSSNASWAQEISLDLDMVSAICPNCHILLVEANSNSYSDLATATRYAEQNAKQVSNSYGGGESGTSTYAPYYDGSAYGSAVMASSGDNGYGVEFPASAPTVTAVGGTSLSHATNTRGWSETVWSGAGSGCSTVYANAGWQPVTSSCSTRTVADVSAVANPNTGVSVYDSTPYGGASGWMVFGGTSVASPIIASVNALTGGGTLGMAFGSFPYNNAGDFYDVTSGSNGRCGTYLCTGTVGYDGPTGMGTPNVASVSGGGGGGTNPPVLSSAPTLNGTPVETNTLTTDGGQWSNAQSVAIQWMRCSGSTCSAISGKNGTSYTLTAADVGSTIEVQSTATAPDGSTAQSTSAKSATVAALLTASPSSISIARGQSATFKISENGGASPGTSGSLGVTGLGSGWTPSAQPIGGPGTSANVTITTTSASATGTRTLTITAPNGSKVTVSLTVRKR